MSSKRRFKPSQKAVDDDLGEDGPLMNGSDMDDDDQSDGGLTTTTNGKGKKKSKGGFHAMKLSDETMLGIRFLGFKQPTPIQRKAIPPALLGRDVVAMARTGSGKTAAFLIPLIERLKNHAADTRAVVLSPTRELAQQTYKIGRNLGKRTDLRFCLLQGGDALEAQFEALAACPDVLIATPGRLAHLLLEARDFSLGKLEMMIVDEADRLFEMGFAAQLQEIFSRTPDSRQTLLFSATMPKQLADFARVRLREPELIRLDTDVRVSDTLKLAFFKIRSTERPAALVHLLRTQIDCSSHSTIVFCGTKHEVEFVGSLIRAANIVAGAKASGTRGESSGRKFKKKSFKRKDPNEGFEDDETDLQGVALAHGSMDQTARTAALEKFRSGKVKIFVVTDLAARGLDIPHVNNVINYDFPDKAKLFVHRVGRAARQGRPGTAYSLASQDEMGHLVDVMLFLGRPLETPVNENGEPAEGEPSILGLIPQSIMDTEVEFVNQLVIGDAVLAQLQKSAGNAHKMYVKTRGEPSKRSVRRSKELTLKIHPIFGNEFKNDAADDINGTSSTLSHSGGLRLEDLAAFRPKKTTFEVEQSKSGTNSAAMAKTADFLRIVRNKDMWKSFAKKNKKAEDDNDDHVNEEDSVDDERGDEQEDDASSEGHGNVENVTMQSSSSSKSSRVPVSKEKVRLSAAERKRAKKQGLDSNAIHHMAALNSDKRAGDSKPTSTPAPGAPTGAFRDTKFYVSNEASTDPSDDAYESQLRVNRLEDAVLDLGDDTDIAQKARTYQWDKKKKKFVQATMKDHVDAKRLKKGAEVLDIKNLGETYDKWSKKTRKRIGGERGADDDSGGEAVTDVRKIARMRKEARAANAPFLADGRRLKDELKNEEQLVKQHVTKKRKAEKMAERGSKNKKQKRVKPGADAKVMRVGKQKPKPGQFSRSKVIGGRKGGKFKR